MRPHHCLDNDINDSLPWPGTPFRIRFVSLNAATRTTHSKSEVSITPGYSPPLLFLKIIFQLVAGILVVGIKVPECAVRSRWFHAISLISLLKLIISSSVWYSDPHSYWWCFLTDISTFLYFYSVITKKNCPIRNLNINFTPAQCLTLDITTYSYAHKFPAYLLHIIFSSNFYLFQLSWWFPSRHCVKCSIKIHLDQIPSFFPCLDINCFIKELSVWSSVNYFW